MMLSRFRIVTHLVMRRVVGVHVLELAMRTGAHPVANAARMILRAGGDEAAFVMMTMLRGERICRREADSRQSANTDQRT